MRGPLCSTLGSPWVSRGCAFAAGHKGQQLLRVTALASCKLRARNDLHLINCRTFCCLELEAHLCSVLVPALANTSADCWQEASRPASVALSLQPVGAGYNLFEERPKLAAWRSRVEEAVGKQLCQEAHEGILNAKNLTADKIAPELLEHFKHQLLKQSS